MQFWDARTAIVQCMLRGHKNSVISTDLSPAGNVLATGSGDWQARICELACFIFLYFCISLLAETGSHADLWVFIYIIGSYNTVPA